MTTDINAVAMEHLVDGYKERLQKAEEQLKIYRRSYKNLLPRLQKLEWLEEALYKVEALAFENNAVGIAFTQHLLADENIPLDEAIRYLRACKRALHRCKGDLAEGEIDPFSPWSKLPIGEIQFKEPEPEPEEEEDSYDPKELARISGRKQRLLARVIAFVVTLFSTFRRGS